MLLPSLTNRWSVLALVFLVRVSQSLHFQTIPPITPFLVDDLGLDYTQIGILIGVYMAPGVFLALPGGMLVQRFGDKRMVIASLLLMTLGALLLGSGDSFAAAFAARVLGGVGMVLLSICLTKVVTDWFAGKELPTAMAIMISSWPFGIALSLSTLGWIAELATWRTAVLATAAYSGLALGLAALLMPTAGPASTRGGTTRWWMITPCEVRLVVLAAFVWLLFNVATVIYLSFGPTYLIELGWGVAAAGLGISIHTWGALVTIPLGGWLTDKLGRVNLAIIGGSLVTAVLFALLQMHLPGPILLVLLATIPVAVGPAPGAIMSLTNSALRQEARATGLGIFYTVFYLGMAVFPALAGAVQDWAGTARAPLAMAAMVMTTVGVALLAFRVAQRNSHLQMPVAG